MENTTKNTFAVYFFLKKRGEKKKKNDGAIQPKTIWKKKNIQCRITINGDPVDFASFIFVDPQKWHSKDQNAIGNSVESQDVNTALIDFEKKIRDIYKESMRKRGHASPAYIRDRLNGKVTNKTGVTLIQYFDDYNLELKKLVKLKEMDDETRKRYVRTRDRLKAFLKREYKRDDIYLDEVDVKLANGFYLYIRETTESGNNNAQKHIEKLRTIITDAWGNGYIPNDSLIRYNMHYDESDPTYLTWHELKRIMHKKFHSERLEKIRDMFVFACFKGMAYGDIRSLTEENFNIMNDNNEWIDKDRNKTKVKAEILFSDIPKLIIEKYKDRRINNRLIPIISNQKSNDYLKEIATLCKVNKNLTCHVARHTFATTVTLTEGVPLETVSKMLGHKNISTTQIYAKVVHEKMTKDANEWNEKMQGIENEFNLQNQ